MDLQLTIERTKQSRIDSIDWNNLPFGKFYSDHMLIAEYFDERWQSVKILPFGDIPMSPATSSIHYGQSIFEGMKAFRGNDGEDYLFRSEDNRVRFNLSAERMGMPDVPAEIFTGGLQRLVDLDRDWVPTTNGCALYLRPFMFAADEFIGVRPTTHFKFIIITSPCGIYYPNPVNVLVADKYVRAFPGGTGFAKAAGNYGATMMPLQKAHDLGFQQILWMDGAEFKYCEEIGTMNFFVMIGDTVLTPELDGTILNGVTRDCVIQIFKKEGIKVAERKVSIHEIMEAGKNGTLRDAFGTGTAATIAPIAMLSFKGTEMHLPDVSERPLSLMLKKKLDDLRTLAAADEFNWMEKIPHFSHQTVPSGNGVSHAKAEH